jgi:hypothetical protein
MKTAERELHVFNTLSSLEYEYHIDECGFIVEENNEWRIELSDDDEKAVVVTFGEHVRAGDAGIFINRISWLIKFAGLNLQVNRGYFTPRTIE